MVINSAIIEVMQFIKERYGSYDPYFIADYLNIEVDWADIGPNPLGETIYDNQEPIIVLSNSIKDSPQRYFVMAHELGHVIAHDSVSSYYALSELTRSKMEVEADKFAMALLANFYVEEHGHIPKNVKDLKYEYGFPINM